MYPEEKILQLDTPQALVENITYPIEQIRRITIRRMCLLKSQKNKLDK